MFTGIIEELGLIRQITSNKVVIDCKTVLENIKLGDSIAVNGVCLTVTELSKNGFTADVSHETVKVTSFENLKSGDFVNLERAMKADGRFGGHMVSGHTDGRGKFIRAEKNGDFYNMCFELNEEQTKYIVKKGSIAVNGISLTVADIIGNSVYAAIIPHTFENTNLKYLKSGEFVNIEVDMLAKYVEKFLSTSDNKSGIDYGFLQENGYL